MHERQPQNSISILALPFSKYVGQTHMDCDRRYDDEEGCLTNCHLSHSILPFGMRWAGASKSKLISTAAASASRKEKIMAETCKYDKGCLMRSSFTALHMRTRTCVLYNRSTCTDAKNRYREPTYHY